MLRRRSHYLKRHFYPVDWPQLSSLVRARADGRCSVCGRPHMTVTEQDATGTTWRAVGEETWRDDHGAVIAGPDEGTALKRVLVKVQACHKDHSQGSLVGLKGLVAMCGRHHLRHDQAWSLRERQLTVRARFACGDLLGRLPGSIWPAVYPR